MKCTSAFLLFLPVLLAGCISSYRGGDAAPPNSSLSVEVSVAGLGMEPASSGVRLYVDGRFVGNYRLEHTVLGLQPGTHTIKVDVPTAYRRVNYSNGTTGLENYHVTGEQKVEILGGSSRQTLVFNSTNLKATRITQEE